MSESTIRHSYISMTRSDAAGVVHTEVVHTEVRHAEVMRTDVETTQTAGTAETTHAAGTSEMSEAAHAEDSFDPASCCDKQERIMIASLREYLRPTIAPECLIQRLNETLDRCCCDIEEHQRHHNRQA